MTYIKKKEEIEVLKDAGQKMGVILAELEKMVVPGVSAWEIDVKAEHMILDVGGIPAFKGYRARPSDTPFPSTICASVNEEVVHGIATKEKVLKDGDIFSIDIGMQYPKEGGLFVDTALTVPVGDLAADARQLIEVTREALEVGIRAVRPGGTVADIGKAIETFVKSKGKYGIVRDLVGHGVGHAVHEEPRVPNYYDRDLEKWILEPGVVLALEPMITLGTHKVQTADDGWSILSTDKSLSAHFEHTIVVTEAGAQVVTRRPDEV